MLNDSYNRTKSIGRNYGSRRVPCGKSKQDKRTMDFRKR